MDRLRIAHAASAAALAAGAIVVAGSSPVIAQTVNQGCANGQTAYQTSFLIEHGFSAEFLAAGDLNGDGIVCARPLTPRQQEKFCSQFVDGCQQPVILAIGDNTRGKGY